jgi:23S rRNA pseudouridine2605 synthase
VLFRSLEAALINGIRTNEGELLRAKQARVLRTGERNAWIEIVLDEGKNRQIRRILEQLGMEVLRLVRTTVGPLLLGDLAKGKVRALTAAEKRAIDVAMKTQGTRQDQKREP